MPSISLVICTYRRPRAMGVLLDSISEQVDRPDQLIVVDASEDDDTARIVEGHHMAPEIDFVRVGDEDRGLTKQRNVGIDRSASEVIAFVDDDTVLAHDYIAELRGAFTRNPSAIGVGAAINGTDWEPHTGEPTPNRYVIDGWGKSDSARWRLRRRLRLVSDMAPGWMPRSGHGRSSDYPPTGEDYPVEFVFGGASAFRSWVFDQVRFSPWYEGYGLYEDLDFCVRAGRLGPIMFATRVRLDHYHAPGGRPDHRKYGRMVVENGWRVWRTRWPSPPLPDRLRWWATTLVLIGCRAAGSDRRAALSEALGRLSAIPRVAHAEFSHHARAELLADSR